ncbi:MAG: 16S rRNA (cytosine(967)-C(5))-methyltransferase RsmB [Thiohalomonadales bacterium]
MRNRKNSGKPINARVIAANILVAVSQQGHRLEYAIKTSLPAQISPKDAAFVKELSYGGVRHWIQLLALVNSCLQRPLKNKDADISALMVLGLYQLIYLRVPDHAALSATVNAVVDIGKAWAKNLVNGVLRNLQRNYKQKLSELASNPEAEFNHPDWMLRRLKQQWPDNWRMIVVANDEYPPLTMRVNHARITTSECLARLASDGISAEAVEGVSTAIRLSKALDVTQMALFTSGLLSVQDSAAQLAAPLLQLGAHERVLDMCAAPGGKTGHILENRGDLQELVSVEIESRRSDRIVENLSRLKLRATVVTADATTPQAWWDKRVFDKILLDVPCSASGVIRRHPDIKLLRSENDLSELLKLQQKILTEIWPLLRPGGMLLYVTCSVFQEENAQQIEHFLARHSDATAMQIDVGCGVVSGAGLQILPGQSDMDGFYYARLKKLA